MKTQFRTWCATTVMIMLLAVMFSGCAGGVQPVSEETLNEAGEVVKVTTKYVADASVAKEEAVHKTLQSRDRAIVQDGKNSGMKMEWTTVEETISFPGQQPIVMKRAMPVISFKERGRFDQKLPTEPSVHPGYAMTRGIVKDVVGGMIIFKGIDAGADVLKSALDSSGGKQTINADSVEISDSRTTVSNTGAESQIDVTGTMPAAEPLIFEAGTATAQ